MDEENDMEVEEISAEPEPEDTRPGSRYIPDTTDWNGILGFLFHPLFVWSVIGVGILIFLNWIKIQKYLDQIYEKRSQREYDAKCHKNPDWVANNHERMDESRRKMQERYNIQASNYQVKQSEKEQAKRLEKLEKTSGIEGGHRLGNTSSNGRPDYNPLVGDSGGRYRPQKKNKCPGGGCG